MGSSLGRVTAKLIQRDSETVTASLISLLNKNINPPQQVTEADVFVRAMYIVSDEVNSFGGRFPSDELARLTELLVDSPVMVGHRKDKLPIGRNFHALITERSGRTWVKAYFYWLKKSEGSESLRENIDGGIYKECSIGFTFGFPECSVCGKDIRTCAHEPSTAVSDTGQAGQNNENSVFFNYRKIERVLETSLVYRGAVTDTSVSKELSVNMSKQVIVDNNPVILDNLTELVTGHDYLVTPNYEGLQVSVSCLDGVLKIDRSNAKPLDDRIIKLFDNTGGRNFPQCDGLLIGYRGKERCRPASLERYLNKESSSVTRLEIKIYPGITNDVSSFTGFGSHHRIAPIRHTITDRKNLESVSKRLATSQGVRIWPLTTSMNFLAGYIYNPNDSKTAPDYSYQLSVNSSGEALFVCATPGVTQRFLIRQYNLHRFKRGGRFLADQVNAGANKFENSMNLIADGELKLIESSSGGWLFKSKGKLTGRLAIRPVKLGNRARYLFYLVSNAVEDKQILKTQSVRVTV